MIQKTRTEEFCLELLANDIDLVWEAQTRANYVYNEELLKLMKKSGLIQLEFGVESGSQHMLDAINKQQDVREVIRAFDLCKKVGIRTYANILLNLPGETKKDVEDTERLLACIRPSSLGVALTVPLFGTKIYHDHVKPPLTTDEYCLYNTNPYYQIVDPRFKLCAHDLDFTDILVRWGQMFSPFAGLTLNIDYWLKILTSRYILHYLYLFISEFAKKEFHTIFNERDTPGLARLKRKVFGVKT
jgi:radical SAM superfamily enzyme YgiQ (UPF0313 family)